MGSPVRRRVNTPTVAPPLVGPRVDSIRRENRSAGPDLSRKQSGRRRGAWGASPLPSSLVMEAESREARAWPLPRACSPWAWCATHPASALTLSVEFVNSPTGSEAATGWLRVSVKHDPSRRWGFDSLPTHKIRSVSTPTTTPGYELIAPRRRRGRDRSSTMPGSRSLSPIPSKRSHGDGSLRRRSGRSRAP